MNKEQIHNKPSLTETRKLLRSTQTAEEALLWKFLKSKKIGYKIRRQHSVDNYILDFYCAEKLLAIEIDGAHHFTPEGLAYDKARTEHLQLYNIRVLRFTNAAVRDNPHLVVEQIKQALFVLE